jgi:hypothetical protein
VSQTALVAARRWAFCHSSGKKFATSSTFSQVRHDNATTTMSKSKKTEVKLPGLESKLKSKSKSQAIPIRGHLSQEFVDSGDSSNEEPTPIQRKAPTPIGVHPPRTNGMTKAAPNSAKKQKDVPNPTSKARVPAKKPLSKQVVAEEYGAESSSGSEGTEDEGTDIRAAQRRQAASTQGGASASSSDSSSEESEEVAPDATSKPATKYALDVCYSCSRA